MLIGNEKHLKFIEYGGKSKSTFHMVIFRASQEAILDSVVTEPGWYLVHLFKLFKYAERESNILYECDSIRKSKTTSRFSSCFIELLPDELLLRILSFLSFPDAIITSTLSKRWKHLWTLRPSIDFNRHILYDYTDLHSYSKAELDLRPSYYKGEDATVGEVTTGVLSKLSNQAQVGSFSLELPFREFLIPVFDACIDFAINYSVCHLHYIMESGFNSYFLPISLFQCSNLLTKLKLHGCAITLPLSSFCLRSLKFMDIGYCCLEKELLERLTSSACCPALESLKLTLCSGEMEPAPLVICLTNPTLWHLCLNDTREFIINSSPCSLFEALGVYGRVELRRIYMLEDVSTLTEASIHFDCREHSHDALPLLKALFAAFPPIKLNVCSWVLKVLFLSAMKEEEVAVPAVVKHLNLRNWLHSVHFFPTLSILCKSLSDIEHLRMNLCPDDCYCTIYENFMVEYLDKKVYNLADVEEHVMLLEQSLQFNNIRTIELKDFYWERREREFSHPRYTHRRWQFEFVRIMLAKLKKLEKLTITSNSKQHGLPSRIAECLSLPRASPEAVIELRICA